MITNFLVISSVYLTGSTSIHAFHGEYMAQYSWAEETLAYILNK